MMNHRNLLRTDSYGTALALICCFTPALVVLVGFAGLSAIDGWLDYGLFPMLFASMAAAIAVAAYAYYLRACLRRQNSQWADTKETIS